ncbi:MAG TPA: EVE domain-containing protein [Dongiaceae bacterium]|jgi:hypothetical protein|nr:EVE domain-containing protein [Dongiaceae bacterium]
MNHSSSPRHWIAVASAEHVATGVAAGIMQVCHGKGGPLRQIRPGDRVIYYSPTGAFRAKDRLQQFTAFGIVRAGEPYQVRMSADFHPYRRDVDYLPARPASILPLLEALEFSRATRNWGWKLRLGLFEITPKDSARIAQAMKVAPPLAIEEPADGESRLPDLSRRGGRRRA